LDSCLRRDADTQEDVETRVGVGLETNGVVKKMCNVNSEDLGVKRVFYEILVLSPVTCGMEA